MFKHIAENKETRKVHFSTHVAQQNVNYYFILQGTLLSVKHFSGEHGKKEQNQYLCHLINIG